MDALREISSLKLFDPLEVAKQKVGIVLRIYIKMNKNDKILIFFKNH